MTIEFTVAGNPMPKGSKTAVVRGKRAVLLDARRGPAREAYAAWEKALATEARAVMDEREPLAGAIALTAVFYLAPPKHETRAQRERVWHTTKPDYDKLARALDPLSGVVIADDARIAHATIWKRYARDRAPGVDLIITQLSEGV